MEEGERVQKIIYQSQVLGLGSIFRTWRHPIINKYIYRKVQIICFILYFSLQIIYIYPIVYIRRTKTLSYSKI